MKRRTFVLGGASVVAAGTIGYQVLPKAAKTILENYAIIPRRIPILVERDFGWKGSDFAAGGTRNVEVARLPPPIFRDAPNCVTTLDNIVGPCDAGNVPIRTDLSEGRTGLPTRLSLRVVDAATCRPFEAAEIQVWHADPRGIYSGRAVSAECTSNDAEAISGLAFRGRQMTSADGIANFLSVYPGWYDGRAHHVHIRVLVGGREVLVSQLFFDDLLSDAVCRDHPDYRGRKPRRVRNDTDMWMPRAHINAHIFDFEKLEGGVLQASYTIGVAA